MNSLLNDFKQYETFYNEFSQNNFNLKNFQTIKPTTLLPLILCCDSYSDFDNIVKRDLRNYLINTKNNQTICFTKIGPSYDFRGSLLENKYFQFIGDINEKNTFNYFFAEILSNVYDHSKFNNAYILAKKYDDKMFDLCFLDDGLSIPFTLKQQKEDNLTI